MARVSLSVPAGTTELRCASSVKKTLEERFPFSVLVEFVQDGDARFRPQSVQLQSFRQSGRTPQQLAPVVGIVPIEIDVRHRTACRRLADLARPTEEGHLAMPLEMVLKQGVV